VSNKQVTLSGDCITIHGEHYTVSNGFVTKAYGEVNLRYRDLLAVEFVKHRSKKMLYAMMLPGGILVFSLNMDNILLVPILAVLTIIVCIMGIAYVFSSRQYVEFTTMRGTYRILVTSGNSEMERTVINLQKRM